MRFGAEPNNSELLVLPQAVWTRFFPASEEIRRLLARGEVGEVKVVRSEFAVPLMHVPRAVQKELGGGAMLDVGIYCLQFTSMVYNGEKPESIQATGVCFESGSADVPSYISFNPSFDVNNRDVQQRFVVCSAFGR